MMSWLRRCWPKIAAGLAITAVAAVTGIVSCTHIYRLTLSLHQTVMVARLMPFGVDGLIVVGSVVLLQPPPQQRWLGWVGVGPGVAISLFANVESVSGTAGRRLGRHPGRGVLARHVHAGALAVGAGRRPASRRAG
jgi:hypothetical protein